MNGNLPRTGNMMYKVARIIIAFFFLDSLIISDVGLKVMNHYNSDFPRKPCALRLLIIQKQMTAHTVGYTSTPTPANGTS